MPIYTCGPGCNPVETPYQCGDPVKTYEGCVLAQWENNGYQDSDFYAAVWDEESQTVKQVMYATTRGWTYHNGCAIDATDEVREKARVWLAEQAYKRAVMHAEDAAKDPTVGKVVRSLTTRGKNKGIVGTIVRREANPYRTYYRNGYNNPDSIYNQRVALKVEGEDRWRWLDADKVEVVEPEPVDHEALRKNAETWAEQDSYISAFSKYWVSA